MAKKQSASRQKPSILTDIDPLPGEERAEVVAEPVKLEPPIADPGFSVHHRTMKVPVAVGCNGYASNRVDLNLTGHQSELLRDVYHGLMQRDATLKGGRHISRPGDAIRWLLEQLA